MEFDGDFIVIQWWFSGNLWWRLMEFDADFMGFNGDPVVF